MVGLIVTLMMGASGFWCVGVGIAGYRRAGGTRIREPSAPRDPVQLQLDLTTTQGPTQTLGPTPGGSSL